MLKYFIFLLVLLPSSLLCQVEICDNGMDDDNDGLIDLNDEDCTCTFIEPTSLIPNPSFEDRNCCPSNRSELNCATGWIQASDPTTDFIHSCGWLGWEQFPPPQPFPDGEGIMGFRDGRVRGFGGGNGNGDGMAEPNWKEYAGACLLSPLRAGTTYRFQFDVGFADGASSPPIFITFFGTADCSNLPFGVGDNAFGCPTNDPNWVNLGQEFVSGGSGDVWEKGVIEVTPDMDIKAIAIGPPCRATNAYENTYYFFDNLLLDDVESFNFQITEVGHPCDPDFTLSVNADPNLQYQWYLSGIALEGEVGVNLSQNYGPGAYQIRIVDDLGCRISLPYNFEIPVLNGFEKVDICEGEEFLLNGLPLETAGIYNDTLSSQNGCDSIVFIDFDIISLDFDTVDVIILEGEEFQTNNLRFTRPGEYPLTFTSTSGCDSLVLLKLSNFNIYIPNAFTPNDDGINDLFQPFVSEENINSYELLVYDRWGELVSKGQSWDGGDFQTGIYVYLIRVDVLFGEPIVLNGSVSLLR